MSENKHDSGADAPGFLESREERIKLLKSGFTGKQIEALFLVLNRFEAVGVDWDGATMKCIPGRQQTLLVKNCKTLSSIHMKAAPSQGASA
ncbi:hypothetical protein METP3_03044 [Methanosarcinales archaeon]|nr:hypothetical protein METP3_03044 [Methanosarcinales archaeon]